MASPGVFSPGVVPPGVLRAVLHGQVGAPEGVWSSGAGGVAVRVADVPLRVAAVPHVHLRVPDVVPDVIQVGAQPLLLLAVGALLLVEVPQPLVVPLDLVAQHRVFDLQAETTSLSVIRYKPHLFAS